MTVVVIRHSSPPGATALTAAQELSRERGEPLVVLAAGSGSDAPGAAELERRAFVDQIKNMLDDGSQWRAELIEPGADAAEAIIEHVRSIGPTVVVIGARHRSAVGKFLFGRDVQRLLLGIEFPILLVKPSQD